MKIKVCYVISNVSHSHVFETTAKFLDRDKYELSFIFLGSTPSELAEKFVTLGFRTEYVRYRSKKDLPSATLDIRKLFKAIGPQIIHTHLVDASLAGLIAARTSGIKERVHTRHHSTESHIHHKRAVTYDKLINRLSKRIIAITHIVEDTLTKMESVSPEKITVINHGFDFSAFKTSPESIDPIKVKYDIGENYPVIGVISRFVEWKGVQYIIPAFAKLTKEFPHAKLVLANAVGNFSEAINGLLEQYLKPEQYAIIRFEPDVFNLYKAFDIFVHVPVNRDYEAFGQTYVEALYLEIPSIFTLSGVAHDFIRDRENAIVVSYRDSEGIFDAFNVLLGDEALRDKITRKGKSDVEKLFNAVKFAADLDSFYQEVLK